MIATSTWLIFLFIFFLSQVVALVHTLMTNKEINLQRVLVVCPLNTVLNWQVEFDKWLSVDDRLEVRYQHFKAQQKILICLCSSHQNSGAFHCGLHVIISGTDFF